MADNAESEAIKKSLLRERKARKLAEQLLEKRATELYLANQELDATIANLKKSNLQLLQSEKMASVGQLAAGVAHEINNPVGFISSNLGTLREYVDELTQLVELQHQYISQGNPAPETEALHQSLATLRDKIDVEFLLPDMSDLVNESIDGVKRIKKIVADLSEFSRSNSDEYEETDINEIIEKTINVAWNELKYKVTLQKEFGLLPAVRCNSGKLAQVFLNLLINASHAIATEGTVTITTREDAGYAHISIRDTGSGIAEEKLAKIFDPFFTTKPVGEGTGLGLHIASSVVDAHGGRIEVESELGTGTCFTVVLPVKGPAESQE